MGKRSTINSGTPTAPARVGHLSVLRLLIDVMIQSYVKSFGLGVVISMRTLVGPAFLSRRLANTTLARQPEEPLHYLTRPSVVTAFEVLAATEIITDKLPGIPDRTVPFQFGGRMVSGGSCGAFLSQAEGQSVLVGSIAGGVGAALGTLVFFNLRQWLHYGVGLPDPLVALAEDVLCVSAGWAIVNRVQPAQQPA